MPIIFKQRSLADLSFVSKSQKTKHKGKNGTLYRKWNGNCLIDCVAAGIAYNVKQQQLQHSFSLGQKEGWVRKKAISVCQHFVVHDRASPPQSHLFYLMLKLWAFGDSVTALVWLQSRVIFLLLFQLCILLHSSCPHKLQCCQSLQDDEVEKRG